jgi:sensor domain CHASE-containing protein
MILILAVLALVFLSAAVAVVNLAVTPAVTSLERDLANENVERVKQYIQSELDYLQGNNQDWAGWDETHQFMLGQNEAFPISNLADESLMTLRINALYLVDPDGRLVWGRLLDLETGLPIPAEEGFLRPLSEETRLVTHRTVDSKAAGILRTRGAPMLLTSFPVLNSPYFRAKSGLEEAGRDQSAHRRAIFIDPDWPGSAFARRARRGRKPVRVSADSLFR